MSTQNTIILTGIDGSNPLGFLAALGTLRTLTRAWPDKDVRMRWVQHSGAWRPEIGADSDELSAACLASSLAQELRCGFSPDPSCAQNLKVAQKEYEAARSSIKKKREEIKGRNLSKIDREAAFENEVAPLQQAADSLRRAWLDALRMVVPFEEMRLGKHLDSSRDEFRETAIEIMAEATTSNREVVATLAAFASDSCYDPKSFRIESTPLCFITGSGHQYFLETARELVACVDSERIAEALFNKWVHRDEKYSMRWDPIEDRRYAHMWTDPQASNNKTKTNWAANLLAYCGVAMFTSVPTSAGLLTTGIQKKRNFIWPIWSHPISKDVVSSLLSLDFRSNAEENEKARDRGVAAIFSSERLVVGNPPLHKINFTPARAVM